jgi:hypothetical protein
MAVLSWAQAIAARIRFLEIMGRTEEIPPWKDAMRKIQPAAEEARRRGM